jgi:orotidine-5'-phosphate decarboxylase
MHFADRLVAAIQKKNSVACVGLDPQLKKLPAFLLKRAASEYGESLEGAANAYLEFNKGIIDAVADLVPAVKPQMAFYEELGHHGVWALEETCKYAQAKGLLVVGDGKRNDIGSTAEAYAKWLGGLEVFGQAQPSMMDALTVNAYLGLDGISPFLKACDQYGKGIFVLVRTSNPSSGDLQSRVTMDEKLSIAELMAHFVESWGSDLLGECGYSAVGAVVGATHPQEAARLRALMPQSFFLVPGYGAQGGQAADVKGCFDEKGLGALVVSARGILYAFAEQEGSGEDFAEKARAATVKMNQELNSVR